MEQQTENQRVVTPGDLDMLDYFWCERGDLSRYCDWRDIQDDLMERFPEIPAAWTAYLAAKQTLTAVIKQRLRENPSE